MSQYYYIGFSVHLDNYDRANGEWTDGQLEIEDRQYIRVYKEALGGKSQ